MYENASPTTPELDEPAPNLEVIYQAFGELADLYRDVLQVKPSATSEQIQMAYFDRRSELFALLASIDSEEEQDDITSSHRFHAERKMDAVVMAVRILGDPELRQEYDNVMALRQNKQKQQQQRNHQAKKQPKEPPSCSASRASSREPDGVYAGVPHDEAPPPSPRGRKSPKRRSPRQGDIQQEQSDNIMKVEGSSVPSSSSSGEDQLPPQLVDDSSDSRLVTPPSPVSPKQKKKHHKHSKGKHQRNHSSSSKKEKSKKKYQPPPPAPPTPPPPAPPTLPIVVAAAADQSTIVVEDDTTFRGDNDNNTLNDTLDEGTLDEGTIASWSTNGDSRRLTRGGTSTLSTFTNKGIVSKIQEEVAGTVEDTLVSFEQVLNVFTLQEKDIKAVMGRIDKAKRQLKKRR